MSPTLAKMESVIVPSDLKARIIGFFSTKQRRKYVSSTGVSNAKKFKPAPIVQKIICRCPRFTQKSIPVKSRRMHWKLGGNGQCASRALFFAAVGLSTLKTKLRRSRRSKTKCRREHRNCISEIYPADRPPAPLKLVLALSEHKIWATSVTPQAPPLSHPSNPGPN